MSERGISGEGGRKSWSDSLRRSSAVAGKTGFWWRRKARSSSSRAVFSGHSRPSRQKIKGLVSHFKDLTGVPPPEKIEARRLDGYNTLFCILSSFFSQTRAG